MANHIYGKATTADIVKGLGSLVETNSQLELSEVKFSHSISDAQSAVNERMTTDAKSQANSMVSLGKSQRILSMVFTSVLLLTVGSSLFGSGMLSGETPKGALGFLKGMGGQSSVNLVGSVASGAAYITSAKATKKLGVAQGNLTKTTACLKATGKLVDEGNTAVRGLLDTNKSVATGASTSISSTYQAETTGNTHNR